MWLWYEYGESRFGRVLRRRFEDCDDGRHRVCRKLEDKCMGGFWVGFKPGWMMRKLEEMHKGVARWWVS